MLERALVFALTLTTAGVPSAPAAAAAPVRQGQPAWQRTDTQHFEIHYLPALARELAGVIRSAERAYDLISRRLNFAFATKVPLIMFGRAEALTRDQVVTYATSDQVAPQHPHRSRIVLPVGEGHPQLDPVMVHELTHLLVAEIIVPQAPGDGGVPRWVHEGIARYMAGGWSEDDERLMRELVAAGQVPALSQLAGRGDVENPRLHDALGHLAFDYIESRWGSTGIRRFIDALIVPRVDQTYSAVFELTPGQFDAAFQQYAERRFRPVVR